MRFSRRRQPQRRSAVAAWASVLLGLSLVLTSFVLAVQPTAATGGGQGGKRDVQIKKDWIGGNGSQVTVTVTYTDKDGNQQQTTRTCPANGGKCGDKIQDVKVGTTVIISEPSPPSGWQPVPSTLSFTLPAGSGTYTHTVQNEPQTTGGGGGDTKGIEVKESHRKTTVTCPQGQRVEWHFVINQIDEESNAPASIKAVFQTAGTVTIPREKFTGGTAHYTYSTPGSDTLVTATATIYSDWDGQFNLSHAECTGEPATLDLRFQKQWVGDDPPGEDVTLTVTVGETDHTVTCQADSGSPWTCAPDIEVEPGQSYTVQEPNVPADWTVTGGTGNFTVPQQCENGVCVHTVTNTAKQTPTRDVEIIKRWQGEGSQGGVPATPVQLIVQVGNQQTQMTCQQGIHSGDWSCGTLEDVPVDTTVTIEEPDVPAGWQADPNTLSFTVTEDTTRHTVVNRLRTYQLSFEKRWQGGDPPASGTVTLTIKRDGSEIGTATCTGDSSTNPWTCTGTVGVKLGDQLTIEESGLDAAWQVDASTLTLTVDANFIEQNCDKQGNCGPHTVVNQKRSTETRYLLRVDKQWQGGQAPAGTGPTLTLTVGDDSVSCTAGQDCPSDTIEVTEGESYSVSEENLPAGWAPDPATVGDGFTFDPDATDDPVGCDAGTTEEVDGVLVTTFTCTHTVVNELVAQPGEEPERTLTLRKQWIGSGRPNSIVLEVTIGSETTAVTCSGSGSLWTCSPALDLPADDDATVVIAEPDVPAGWETTSGTGTFTVGQLCGTAEDCTHTVVNRREREREENPPSPPSPPNQPNQPNQPAQPGGPPNPPPISEASPITASPSPSTPVSEAAPATATPPTRVSEASPETGSRPPQVLPKTGRGDGGSGTLWLLTGLGSLLMAAGAGLELHRRSRRGLRA